MENKRLDYLDMAKGIGMLLVLIGHLQGEQIFTLSPYIHPFCVFIFSFHMPLFFIISGILMNIKKDENKDYKAIAVKRFKGIMIPYYCFSFCYMMVVVNALIKGTVLWNTFFVNLWYVLSGYGMNVLWFLPALYLGELLFIALRKRYKDDRKFIVLVSVLCAITLILSYLLTLPQYDRELLKRLREFATVLLRPFLVCGFISIGYYLRSFSVKDNILGRFLCQVENSEENVSVMSDSVYPKGRRVLFIVLGIVLMAVCAIFSRVNNGIDVRTMVLRNIFFFLLCALSGSFGLILFCKGLPKIKLLCFWGTGSLTFMATHNSETVLYYAMKLAMYVNQYLTRARGYICYAIIITVIVLYTSVMVYIIGNYLPFMLGKSYKKRHK